MKRNAGLLVIMAVMLLLAACGGEKYKAQAINEETDVCAICKMAVKDDQFATQIVTKDGQSLKFDDIGCLNTWKTENGTETIGAAFVRDYNSQQWLRYEKAYYAYDASYQTPMAYGVVSFEKEADALAFIKDKGAGVMMTADQLANHTWEVNHDMMQMDGHGHSSDGGHGAEASGHGEQAAGEAHGEEAAGHGEQPAGEAHGEEASGHDEQAAGEAHGAEASGHDEQAAGEAHGAEASGHGEQSSGGHGS